MMNFYSCYLENQLIDFCKEECLKNLIDLSLKTEHAGCKGESSRLICYLFLISLKYPKLNLNETLNKLNAYRTLIEQMNYQHTIMINEALLSLNICVNFNYSTRFFF